jgi:hypothetical protein
MKQLMSFEWGRRFMYWLIWSKCGVVNGTTDMTVKDGNCASLHSWYYEGQRSIGLDLLELVQGLAPEQQLKMMVERIQEQQSDLALEEKFERVAAQEDEDA